MTTSTKGLENTTRKAGNMTLIRLASILRFSEPEHDFQHTTTWRLQVTNILTDRVGLFESTSIDIWAIHGKGQGKGKGL